MLWFADANASVQREEVMAPSEEAGVVEAAARDASTASTKQRVSVFTGLDSLASGPDGGSD